ncbi:TPA: hypothetical protein JK846_003645 [Escherichia coli]|nr:hypothetical protein [Salmonella enterica subsp. enterica]HAV7961530.1 hypothetical protein [Escherichia coli]
MTAYPFSPTEQAQLIDWLMYGDVGASSRAIVAAALGKPQGDHLPADSWDFGRVYQLYKAVPGLWKATSVILINVPKLAPLYVHWATLSACYRAAPGTPQHERFAQALMDMYIDAMRSSGKVEISPGVWADPI